MVFVRVSAVHQREECPLCRVALPSDPDAVLACATCRVCVHAACAAEMPGCPTLGCRGEPEPEETMAAWRRSQGLPPEAPAVEQARARAAAEAAQRDAASVRAWAERARLRELHEESLDAAVADAARRRRAGDRLALGTCLGGVILVLATLLPSSVSVPLLLGLVLIAGFLWPSRRPRA